MLVSAAPTRKLGKSSKATKSQKTSKSSKSASTCLEGEKLIQVTINTDIYPEENFFSIVDACSGEFVTELYYFNEGQENILYSKDVCVPGNGRYEFGFADFAKDGIDNPEGEFDYSVTYDGETVAGGVFDDTKEDYYNYYYAEFGNEACPPNAGRKTRHLRNKQRKW